MKRASVVVPHFNPVGGIVKVMDYGRHFRRMGLEVSVISSAPPAGDESIFAMPGPKRLLEDPGVRWGRLGEFAVDRDELVLFSWPPQWRDVTRALYRRTPVSRVVHLIQNVRHANPSFVDGYGRRLLRRPMSRISINSEVERAIQHLVPKDKSTSPRCVVPLGHDVEYFWRERKHSIRRPVRVGYTGWKSDLGERIAGQLEGRAFRFEGVFGEAGWEELAALYEWADVFLGTPNSEEGFYLPALEAMAAGTIVVVPDVGGNRSYCVFGTNCIGVEFEQEESYREALEYVASAGEDEVRRLRSAGWETASQWTLEKEFQGLRRFVEHLDMMAPDEG